MAKIHDGVKQDILKTDRRSGRDSSGTIEFDVGLDPGRRCQAQMRRERGVDAFLFGKLRVVTSCSRDARYGLRDGTQDRGGFSPRAQRWIHVAFAPRPEQVNALSDDVEPTVLDDPEGSDTESH